ncbi:hypothetical protein [Arthrobacter pigmenti]|uniref:hypothetical protein n=1 Tax=Arthrobacter pigmenti TaxID=271432 RepID=UPI003CC91D00
MEWLHWPDGFVYPRCDHAGGWMAADGCNKCADCGSRTSMAVGTLFRSQRYAAYRVVHGLLNVRRAEGPCLCGVCSDSLRSAHTQRLGDAPSTPNRSWSYRAETV